MVVEKERDFLGDRSVFFPPSSYALRITRLVFMEENL